MNLSATQIRLMHSLIFFLLTGLLFYALYSAISGQVTQWTWIAIGLIFIEGLVLLYFNWRCPLTIWAENRGAENGAVADLFMPKALADRLFHICGFVYAVTVVLVLVRWFTR